MEYIRQIIINCMIDTNKDTYCFLYDEYDNVFQGLLELVDFINCLLDTEFVVYDPND